MKKVEMFFLSLTAFVLVLLSPLSSHALPPCYANGAAYAQTVAQEVCQMAWNSLSATNLSCSKGSPIDFSMDDIQKCSNDLAPLILAEVNVRCSTGNPNCTGWTSLICDVTTNLLLQYQNLDPVTAMVDFCQCGNGKVDAGEDCDLSAPGPKVACSQDCHKLILFTPLGPLTFEPPKTTAEPTEEPGTGSGPSGPSGPLQDPNADPEGEAASAGCALQIFKQTPNRRGSPAP